MWIDELHCGRVKPYLKERICAVCYDIYNCNLYILEYCKCTFFILIHMVMLTSHKYYTVCTWMYISSVWINNYRLGTSASSHHLVYLYHFISLKIRNSNRIIDLYHWFVSFVAIHYILLYLYIKKKKHISFDILVYLYQWMNKNIEVQALTVAIAIAVLINNSRSIQTRLIY